MFLSRLRRLGAPLAVCATMLAGPLDAQQARATDPLLDLLEIKETLEIMRDEGVAYAATLAEDMLPGPAGTLWKRTLDDIYDLERMEETVRDGVARSFGLRDVNTDALERFFGSELGREIVALEIGARSAMTDVAVEEAARSAYLDARAAGGEDTPRLDRLDAMIEANDLIESNVVGGMNSSVRFYQGLADGGAIELGEGDILSQVWSTEEETRTDTTEWLYGYLMMAYGPLEDSQLDAYLALMASPEGRALNTALFAGFDTMFADISYALGRALAQEMRVEEL
jgi:hypothetical protein